jgi:hypothetical protein
MGKKEMGELANQVSNRPNSFFEGKAVTLEGHDNGRCCFITCGRSMGRNGKVSRGDFQLNNCANKKINTHQNTTTNLSFGGRQ